MTDEQEEANTRRRSITARIQFGPKGVSLLVHQEDGASVGVGVVGGGDVEDTGGAVVVAAPGVRPPSSVV
jgi:hypothetical protein